ncbi:Uncharacterised protein [Vibrio parahaemolyticus]|nr:Uncharacterised protein [Vibrio parahaemolyticus]
MMNGVFLNPHILSADWTHFCAGLLYEFHYQAGFFITEVIRFFF